MCTICGSAFSSVFNLKRHQNTKHAVESSEKDSIEEEEEEHTDADEDMESEAETIRTGDTDSSDDDESPTPDDLIVGNKSFFWRKILETAYKNMRDFPDTIEELKNFEYFPELVELMRKFHNMHDYMQLSLENSNIHDKLSKYQYTLEDKKINARDAKELAWDHLKFLFKHLIDRNPDLFDEEMQRRESKESQ